MLSRRDVERPLIHCLEPGKPVKIILNFFKKKAKVRSLVFKKNQRRNIFSNIFKLNYIEYQKQFSALAFFLKPKIVFFQAFSCPLRGRLGQGQYSFFFLSGLRQMHKCPFSDNLYFNYLFPLPFLKNKEGLMLLALSYILFKN